MSDFVYLDYAATTPMDPLVIDTMSRYLGMDGCFANPASRSHRKGWQAEQAVESARSSLAELLSCDPRELVWTSGATEANNLAIKGVCTLPRQTVSQRPGHIVTSVTEHKAVLDPIAWLEGWGYGVTRLQPDGDGRVGVEQVMDALCEDTRLVSLMWVNNETGVMQDIAAIAEALKSHPAFLHVDAAQACGKIPIDLKNVAVDLLSVSAHKFYGPKGAGALFVRRRAALELEAQIHGGGHERGLRSGTLPTHQIVGLGKAADLAVERQASDYQHLQAVNQHFLETLDPHGRLRLHGQQAERFPGILNLAFPGMDTDTLLMALPHLAMSSGSACTSASVEPSHVLKGMGVSRAESLSSLRISFGRPTRLEEAEMAARDMAACLQRLGCAGFA